MFARIVSEAAAALLAGCGRVFHERGERGMRDAEGSTCPAIMVDFAVVRRALSRARADDSFSVSAATVDLISVVAELVLNDAGSGSIGRLAAARSKQLNLFASVHDSMAACGGKRQLQPTKVAASAPMSSTLMQFLLRGWVPLAFLLRDSVGADRLSFVQRC
jgi:hypothetical protein